MYDHEAPTSHGLCMTIKCEHLWLLYMPMNLTMTQTLRSINLKLLKLDDRWPTETGLEV